MANSSEYTIRVRVNGAADVEAVKKAIEGLGATVKRTKKGMDDANGSSQDFYDTQKKGIIGTANSTKSFSKLAETIGGNSSGLVGAYATLAANVFAASAAFNGLRSASQVEQIFRGLEAAGARTGLSLNTTAQSLREVTGAAISTEQAMRSTAQIVSAGFSGETVERLGKAARDASFALGRNMTDSLDRLSRGVVKLEPELLDELGIMTKLTESNVRYAQTLGKTESQLTNFEKRTGFLNAVIAEAELKFGGLSEAAGDSANYDKLVAKLSDTSNSFLNIINTLGKPLAGILASSSATIAGAFALVIASLKNQLLPGLTASVLKSREAALASKELAAAKLAEAKATTSLAAAEQQRLITSKATFQYIGTTGANVYRQGREEIIKTIGTTQELTKEQKKGINSLNASIRANRNILNNNASFAKGTEKGDAKRLEQAGLIRELRAVEQLRAARLAAANEDIRNSEQVAAARRAATVARLTASSQEAAANSIAAASQLKVGEAWAQLTRSVNTYTLSLVAAGTAGNTALTGIQKATIGARTALFATATAARALGTALLTALPWIGLITVAVGLLQTAWEALKSDSVKEMEKDLESFNEVAAKAVQYSQEMTRANEASVSASVRASQALTIQSNAVREIAESYQQLVDSRNKVDTDGVFKNLLDGLTGSDNNADTVASFWETLGKRSILSYQLGIKRNSKVLDLAEALPRSTDRGDEAIKTLNSLNEAAPKELDKWIVKNYGSWEQLNDVISKSPEQLEKVARTVSQDLNKALGSGAEAVKSYQEAMKQLESDLSNFYRSSAISTPFDAVVKSISAANNSVIALSQSFKTGSSDWKALLTGIDANTATGLSAKLQQDLKAFNEYDAKLQDLAEKARKLTQETNKTGVGQDAALRATNAIAAAQEKSVAAQTRLATLVEEELMASEKRFLVAQETTRQTASQLTLLQAQIGANSEIYKGGAAGMRAKIKDEERVRDLQKLQLQVQVDVLKASVTLNESREAGLRLKISENEQELKTLQIMNEQRLVEERTQLARKGISGNALDRMAAAGARSAQAGMYAPGSMIDKQTADQLDSYLDDTKRIQTTNEDILKQKTELRAVEQASRDILASIKSLSTQIAAIDAANLTEAEKRVAYQKAELELRSGSLSALRAQQKTLDEVNTTYEEINALVNGTNSSLRYQVNTLTRAASIQRETAAREYSDRQRELNLSLQAAKAQASRALATEDQKQAANALVTAAQEAITLSEQSYNIDRQKIDAQERLSVLQKITFDTQKDGLEWQQEALSMLEKQLSTQRELAQATLETYSLRQKLDAKRQGYEVSAAGEEAATIKAAESAYQLAVQEVSLKKSLIDLEYALLEAQKDRLQEELRVRRDGLVANNDPRDATRIAQLNSTIDRLEAVNTDAIAASAKKALDVGIENARIALQTALEPTKTGAFSQMLGDLRGILNRRSARTEAEGTLATAKPATLQGIIKAESLESRQALKTEVAEPMIASNQKLIEVINRWITTIERSIATTTTIAGSTEGGEVTGTGRVKQALDFFVKKGFTAAQSAGLVGNLQQESSKDLDPTKRNRSSGAYGIAQWLSKDRIEEFTKTFGKRLQDSTFREQLEFIVHELNSTEKAAGNALRNAKTVEEATLIVRKKYERPGEAEANDARRLSYARANLKTTPVVAKTAINDNEPAAVSEITVSTAKIKEIDWGKQEPMAPKLDWDKELKTLETSVTNLKIPEAPLSLSDSLDAFKALTSDTLENLKQLSPEGEVFAAVVEGVTNTTQSIITMGNVLKDYTAGSVEGITAIATALQSAVSGVQSALAASAAAKEAAIQREIDAESKRDGKSAESVAKIAALEKRKDEIAKKQFNTNKKLMMAQAVIGTAAGVAQALGSLPPPASIIMAGLIGAMGAAQLAIISGTQYQSSAANASSVEVPSTLSIGKQGDTVDLAKQNNNVGGELGYLRGQRGYGTNSSNYSVIGSAYGGDLNRGYGNTAMVIGEKGPETLTPETPLTVRPANENGSGGNPVSASISIHALDASGVEQVLQDQKGNIIAMLREASNANGQPFMESVNVNMYSRPNKTAGTKL